MADAGFFKGTNFEQDSRFADKTKKLMKSMNFAAILEKKVDMKKVNLDSLKPWITQQIVNYLKFEDEIVTDFVFGHLETRFPDAKNLQINLTGFLNAKNARQFINDLWALLVSAESTDCGIPEEFVKAKEAEMKVSQSMDEKIKEELKKREAEISKFLTENQGPETELPPAVTRSRSRTPSLSEMFTGKGVRKPQIQCQQEYESVSLGSEIILVPRKNKDRKGDNEDDEVKKPHDTTRFKEVVVEQRVRRKSTSPSGIEREHDPDDNVVTTLKVSNLASNDNRARSKSTSPTLRNKERPNEWYKPKGSTSQDGSLSPTRRRNSRSLSNEPSRTRKPYSHDRSPSRDKDNRNRNDHSPNRSRSREKLARNVSRTSPSRRNSRSPRGPRGRSRTPEVRRRYSRSPNKRSSSRDKYEKRRSKSPSNRRSRSNDLKESRRNEPKDRTHSPRPIDGNAAHEGHSRSRSRDREIKRRSRSRDRVEGRNVKKSHSKQDTSKRSTSYDREPVRRSRSRDRIESRRRSRSRERNVNRRSRSRERVQSKRSRSRDPLPSRTRRSRSHERLPIRRSRSRERFQSRRSRSPRRVLPKRSRSRDRRRMSREKVYSRRSRSRDIDDKRVRSPDRNYRPRRKPDVDDRSRYGRLDTDDHNRPAERRREDWVSPPAEKKRRTISRHSTSRSPEPAKKPSSPKVRGRGPVRYRPTTHEDSGDCRSDSEGSRDKKAPRSPAGSSGSERRVVIKTKKGSRREVRAPRSRSASGSSADSDVEERLRQRALASMQRAKR